MSHELRCDYKLHGIIVEEGVMEVRCGSEFCGSKGGVVVLHRFDVATGELIDTKRFKDPNRKERKR